MRCFEAVFGVSKIGPSNNVIGDKPRILVSQGCVAATEYFDGLGVGLKIPVLDADQLPLKPDTEYCRMTSAAVGREIGRGSIVLRATTNSKKSESVLVLLRVLENAVLGPMVELPRSEFVLATAMEHWSGIRQVRMLLQLPVKQALRFEIQSPFKRQRKRGAASSSDGTSPSFWLWAKSAANVLVGDESIFGTGERNYTWTEY